MNWKKFLLIPIVLLFLLFFLSLLLFFDGYRFSASSAADYYIRHSHTSEQRLVLEESISPDLSFHLLDRGDSYHTIYSRRYFFLWKSYYGDNSYRKKADDKIELLNKFWLDDANIGWIVSTSHDPNVTSFKVSYADQTIEKIALKNEPTVIVVPAPNTTLSGMDIGFEASALSKDDVVLYRLNYLMEKYHVTTDYGWHPVLPD